MKLLTDFFSNYVLVCAIIGWFSAQLIKCVIHIVKNHEINFSVIMASGGMPSSHSSTVCALFISVARLKGVDSLEFALAFVLAFIVMYDAAGVRRAAGEQAKVLNRIAQDIQKGETRYIEKDLKELIGHTPLQVFMGALLGIIIPFIVPIF